MGESLGVGFRRYDDKGYEVVVEIIVLSEYHITRTITKPSWTLR
jgi:hypothetical protein